MSKLPVISGAECIKALGKSALKYIDNAAVTSSWFANLRLPKPQFPITKS